MIRILLPLICAALGFAAASCSQSENPFAPAEAPAPAQATSHGAASAAMASPPSAATPADQTPSLEASSAGSESQASASQSTPEASSDAPASTPADRRASTLIGMPVVSGDGSPVGEVKDIIFDRQGRATHLVIAYGTAPPAGGAAALPDSGSSASNPDGKLTAMPWDAAIASMKDGRLVLDDTKLQAAPSFTPHAWPNLDNPTWNAAADAYWRKAVRAAIAAHPGTPIDSPDRQRGRRARDGDGNGDGQ